MKLKQGSRLLFTGDSVTDVGRNRPVAQGTLFDPLGKGYPHIVSGLINAVYPGWGIHVINSGNSGDTSRRLAARWQTDVLDFKPDWVSVMIGINDVWRQFDSPCQPEEQVGPEEYEETLDGLFRRTRPLLAGGLVVMLPFYLELHLDDAKRGRLVRYQEICRELAARYDALLVDTQGAFDRLLAERNANFVSWDRVHPNNVGHSLLAREFLRAVDFDFYR